MIFNRNPLIFGNTVATPTQEAIKATPGLFRASLEDAFTYGGDVTREALGAVKLVGDKKHVVVDVKVHMLMPDMVPAIPGWHTDGVPRDRGDNKRKGNPDIYLQEIMESPHFHLLVHGNCTTEFYLPPVDLNIPKDIGTDLYKWMSIEIDKRTPNGRFAIRSSKWHTWNWWDIHRARPAQVAEWRYLIRVTETDDDKLKPSENLRDVLRNQNQVYLSMEYGW
jgi:hypothetical protein